MSSSNSPAKQHSGGDGTPNHEASEPGSAGSGIKIREKKRVGFIGANTSIIPSRKSDESNETITPTVVAAPVPSSNIDSPLDVVAGSRQHSITSLETSDSARDHLPQLSAEQTREIHEAFHRTMTQKPRSAIRRSESNISAPPSDSDSENSSADRPKAIRRARAKEAFERGRRLAEDERARSEPNSRASSVEKPRRAHIEPPSIPVPAGIQPQAADLDSPYDVASTSRLLRPGYGPALYEPEDMDDSYNTYTPSAGLRSGVVTPTEEKDFIEDYQPKPQRYRGGVLGSLLKLYGDNPHHSTHLPHPGAVHLRKGSDSAFSSAASSPAHSPPSSGTNTPLRGSYFPFRSKNYSTSSLAHLVGSSASLGSTGFAALPDSVHERLREDAAHHRSRKSRRSVLGRMGKPRAHEEQILIKIHIAETIARQKYLLKLCRALMLYGAPTHRLEEYINMSARVLAIEVQCLYIPGSMIISLDDPATHTTEVQLVRCNQGLDLGKLRDVHEVYKEVVHDRIGVDEATSRLKAITSKKDKHSRLLRVPIYGLAAVSVGPFAFGARFIDLPISFLLGCILGILQLYVAPRSDLYANVFEIAATVITSFLARAFGSIKGGDLFCFSALAQSSIALILPGYTVLCASLELQSKNLVAGSVRMVYAIIYSLFLGYGITIGSAIYGLLDHNATSAYTCSRSMEAPLFFFFVPIFTMCLIIINQAQWKQAPVMLVISFVGYLVNFYSSQRFTGNTQVSNTLGALAIGVMANLYSRIGNKVENWFLDLWEDTLRSRWRTLRKHLLGNNGRRSRTKKMEEGLSDNESTFVRQTRRVGYGLAAAAMLPAIFVQVPSGLSVQGSLISGLASANQITGNSTNGTTVANVTNLLENASVNNTALTVGYSVIQVAIGITVGLFLSAVVVYPLGKRRSGLFSF